MKPILLNLLLLSAALAPSITRAQDQPQSQTATETEKKKGGGFGRFMKGLGEVAKDVILVNGQPIGSSSGGNSGSGNGFFSSLGSNTVRGEWKGHGAGGHDGNVYERYNYGLSGRNHHYTFEISQEDTKGFFTLESNVNALVRVFSPNGQYILNVKNGTRNEVLFTKTGTYDLLVTADRYSKGKYELKIEGPVKATIKKEFDEWEQSDVSFGEEGGGGGGSNAFSPRNHLYIFEPELDSYFDINIESNGVPMGMTIIDPNGSQQFSNDNGAGIRHRLLKATSKGKYYIYVYTAELNARGKYEIDVVGKLKEKPIRVETKFKLIQGQFAANTRKHEYTIPAQPGNIEILYRSTTTEADFKLTNAYNQVLWNVHDYTPTSRLIDRSVEIKQTGNITLSVNAIDTQDQNPGNYELLVWGQFDEITGKQIKTPVIKPKMQPKPVDDEPVSTPESAPTTVAANQVTLSGQVKSRQAGASYTTMHVVYEDLETGERVGEVIPDAVGTYTIIVSRGKRYGITALTEEGTIASSQNIDLTRTTPGSLRVPVIDVVETEVGESINLNNIFFQTGKATLLPASYAELNRIGKFLKDHPGIRIEIAGHTDNQGSAPINKVLSTDRALAVAYNLQGQQIKQDRVSAVGYGPAKPVAPNTTENGRAMNRRVEFRIVGR